VVWRRWVPVNNCYFLGCYLYSHCSGSQPHNNQLYLLHNFCRQRLETPRRSEGEVTCLPSSSYLASVCFGWVPSGNAECLIRSREDLPVTHYVEFLAVPCVQFWGTLSDNRIYTWLSFWFIFCVSWWEVGCKTSDEKCLLLPLRLFIFKACFLQNLCVLYI
jgi:hypothetical protein